MKLSKKMAIVKNVNTLTRPLIIKPVCNMTVETISTSIKMEPVVIAQTTKKHQKINTLANLPSVIYLMLFIKMALALIYVQTTYF